MNKYLDMEMKCGLLSRENFISIIKYMFILQKNYTLWYEMGYEVIKKSADWCRLSKF